MTTFMPRGARWLEIGAVLALFLVIHVTAYETDLATSGDCYYNYNHYSEGDRILTNEPCLNCTCHNKMLMCYLKVCPFTKPIGQDCTVEKRDDQCCPIITCPEVPVELDHSSGDHSTDLATHQNHGCSIDDEFYPEGAQIPGNPKKPCELCYCIRNMTSCVMQECTLHVDGCRPIYNKGVCCPVRYDCAHEEEMPLMLEDQTTTEAPSQGFVITTTSAPIQSTDCYHNGVPYIDGENIDTDQPCEHCYCMRGDIVCAVQECKPLEMHGKNCTARTPGPGECCPQLYECESDLHATTLSDEIESPIATTLGYQGDVAEPVLTTTQAAISSSDHIEKDAITTEEAIADTTSQRIDESENEIHDKDYDHMTVKQPSRSNFTAQQTPEAINDRIEGEDSTTLLSKLEDIAATTVLSESGPASDEQITTVLPIAGLPQSQSEEKDATESQGILSNLYTTIKSIVDFTTTLSPIQEQHHKQHDDEEFLSNVIPGEGDCLDNGVTYGNNTNVPSRIACEESCLCHNSIVRCEKVKCAPMPPNAENCKVLHEEGLCCPSYHCESMEYSTGTPPTHPAESQVIHHDDEPHVDSTTLGQVSDDEQQTNAIDSKLDSTTVQSAQSPISSKLDDTYELKPEITTDSEFTKGTNAPEIESSTAAKVHDEIPSDVKVEDKLGAEPVQTEEPPKAEQPAKEEIATEAATDKNEPESTTLHTLQEANKQDDEQVQKIEHIPQTQTQPEIEQPTTQRAAEELPQENASTELPGEKLHDESAPTTQASEKDVTTQAPSVQSEELTPTTQKAQQDAEISTEHFQKESDISTESQQAAQPDIQIQDEYITTEESSAQKGQQHDEISTEAVKESEISTEGQQKESEISTEGQQKESEISTEGQQKESEISTESAQPATHDDMKSDEFVPTDEPVSQKGQQADEIVTVAPESQKEEEITTENQQLDDISTESHQDVQPAVQSQDEHITTEEPSGQKIQQQDEISTESHHENEISTEGQQKESEISTESEPSSQPELQTRDEFVTTEGAVVHKIHEEGQTQTHQPEVQSQDEYVTTEKSEQAQEQSTEHKQEQEQEQKQESSSTEQNAKQPEEPSIVQDTTELAQSAEGTTSRIGEAESPTKLAAFDESQSTEKQIEEQGTENLIPDSSTDGHVEKQHDEISTEKHIEPAEKVEQITTENVAAPEVTTQYEQQSSEEGLSQTTLSSAAADSKLSDETQQKQGEEEQAQTTAAPKPSIHEADATEKLPEFNEITSEHIPLEIEDHKTEKDIYVPATESQQTATEHIQPQIVGNKDEYVTEGISSSEYTNILGDASPTEKPQSKPDITSTEQTVKEESSSTEQIVKQDEISSTEHTQEEQTTLATSKLTLNGISPNEFKEGEVVSQDEKQDDLDVESDATTTEKLHDETSSITESTQHEPEQKPEEEEKPEQQPELTSSEGAKESIATEQPAIEQTETEQPAVAVQSHDEEITQAPAVSEEEESSSTEKETDSEAPAVLEEKESSSTEKPTESEAPAVSEEKESSSTEKQTESEATTVYLFPSKQEDLDIITEHNVPSKQEDLEIVTSHEEETKDSTTALYDPTVTDNQEHHDIGFQTWQATESDASVEPTQAPSVESTQAPSEADATTPGKVSAEQPKQPASDEGFLEEQHIPPSATDAQHVEQATPSIEHDEQTTFGVITEKSTEGTEIKQDQPLPTTEAPAPKPELESGNQIHIADEEQPQLPVTTQAAKQDEFVAQTTTASVAPSENRIGEEQTHDKVEESQQPITEDAVSEGPKEQDEKVEDIPKEEEKPEIPHIQLATTEQTLDVTTLLNKIHDESISHEPAVTEANIGAEDTTSQKQEQEEVKPELSTQTELPLSQELPQQQTEQSQQQTEQPQQQTEKTQEQQQPESTAAPVQHDEKPDSQPIDENVTTEQAAVSSESTTQGVQQPAQSDEISDAQTTAPAVQEQPMDQNNRIHEIPSDATTVQPQHDETTKGVESTSVHSEPAQVHFDETTAGQEQDSTSAPVLLDEQTTQHQQQQEEAEKLTESQDQAVTQKDKIEHEQPTETSVSHAPVESSSQESAPVVPETTAFEQEAVATSTSEPAKSEEPIKQDEPSIIAHDELPVSEVTTEQHIEGGAAHDEEQPTQKPSILDVTTIKSVVELITTLHPIVQQEADVTTAPPQYPADVTTAAAAQPIFNRVDSDSTSAPEQQATESAAVDNKTSDEGVHVYDTPPESANNIPLIRDPSLHTEHFNEITTKLAESFDTTTLPSNLLTSSHTERISDSTTIKNTQNEITEAPAQSQTSDESLPEQSSVGGQQPEPDAQQPSYPSFDSGYGNVPSQYPDEEYTDEEEPAVFGPGTCRYGGKLYVSAQQIPRDDPCDFCFCFRSDIICLQQSCPPPITGCHEEPIQGFCCPRYECPVSMGIAYNASTTTTTTLPPYLSHFHRNSGKVTRSGCQIQGISYKVGERVTTASGPCIDCICGGDGQMKCDPKNCTPEPMLRQMIASAKRR